jgi:hypothetical protein
VRRAWSERRGPAQCRSDAHVACFNVERAASRMSRTLKPRTVRAPHDRRAIGDAGWDGRTPHCRGAAAYREARGGCGVWCEGTHRCTSGYSRASLTSRDVWPVPSDRERRRWQRGCLVADVQRRIQEVRRSIAA